jgi:hypothetical protein
MAASTYNIESRTSINRGVMTMSQANSNRLIHSLCIAALLSMGLTATVEAAKPPQTTEDGLVLTKSKKVGVLYTRPGVNLSGYTKVWLDPVQVAFSKNWDPRDYNGRLGLSTADVQKIRDDVSVLARETFVKVLGDGGYPEVSAAGEGVLKVTCYVVDLYVNAPDKMTAGRSRSYVASAGSMVMVVELRDSVTGTLLARAFDRKEASDAGGFQWANSVSNRAEAEMMFRSWAGTLKRALDAAKAP